MRAPKGLEGVVVADTAISDVRAEGQLIYRGLPIETLVQWPFLEVAALVVDGERHSQFESLFAQHGNLTPEEQQMVLSVPVSMHPMQLLQVVIPWLGAGLSRNGIEPRDLGLSVAMKLPAVVCTHLHNKPISLDVQEGYVGALVRGIAPDLPGQVIRDREQALNVSQILQLEHSLNAGTFAARVVASTEARIESAMAAGVAALSGPLHGGADQAVLDLVDGFDSVEQARDFVHAALERGEKIPGMGHREYRARDPRAACLETWAQRVSAGTQHADTYAKLVAVETTFRELVGNKPLYANVEFYKGLVYRSLGLPNAYFTAGFVMARVFGYIAHYLENATDNRIFRPAANYVESVR